MDTFNRKYLKVSNASNGKSKLEELMWYETSVDVNVN